MSANPYEASQTPPLAVAQTPGAIRVKLWVMMFLQFFIWGCWLPVSFGYFGDNALKFDSGQQELLNILFPIAALIAMFGANQFVDRYFAAEKFLAVSHLIGGLAMLLFGWLARSYFQGADQSVAPSYAPFFILMAIHSFFYVPTISVTNSIAFANVRDAQKDFGPIRLWGTIGWIAASWPFIFILTDWGKVAAQKTEGLVAWLGVVFGTPLAGAELNVGKSWAFIVAGIASLILAGFSLLLPHTPPKPKSGEDGFALWEVLKFLQYPFIVVLCIVTWIDATVHDGFFFYAFTYLEKVGVPGNWIQPAMSVGQIAEIATMAGLGYVLKRFGWRYTMIVGVLGHAARFAVFALVPNPYAAVAINILHGVCYAFFFATLYIFVDAVFPKDARTSAQGLFNLLILGLGPITSRIVWSRCQEAYTTVLPDNSKVVEYSKLLLIPSGAAIVAALLLLLFFHPPKKADVATADTGH